MPGLPFTKFKLTPNGSTESYYFLARQNPAWVDAIEAYTGVKAVSTKAEKAEPTCTVAELIRFEKAVRLKIRYDVGGVKKYASILADFELKGVVGTTLEGEPWGGGKIESATGITRDHFS